MTKKTLEFTLGQMHTDIKYLTKLHEQTNEDVKKLREELPVVIAETKENTEFRKGFLGKTAVIVSIIATIFTIGISIVKDLIGMR